MSMRHYIIPIFVPHRGCPYDCIFCNQKKITGIDEKELDSQVTSEEVTTTINKYLKAMTRENAYIEVAFYGGSFTGIPIDSQITLLNAANQFIKSGDINGIRLSTRPDYINEVILQNLKKYGVTTIELGVQSMDDDVLRMSNRGHNREDVYKAVSLIKNHHFTLGLQMMVGLPGDTKQKIHDTVDEIIKLHPDMVRIYPTLVIKGTALEVLYKKGKYIPLQLDEAIRICEELLKRFENNHIKVIRIGLQPTENIMDGKDVIAGPFHPAFRELVVSELRLDRIRKKIDRFDSIPKEIEIRVNPKAISETIGLKRKNINSLKQEYKFDSVKVIQDERLKRKEIQILIND